MKNTKKSPQSFGYATWYAALIHSSDNGYIDMRKAVEILRAIPETELTDDLRKNISKGFIVKFFSGHDIVLKKLGRFVHESVKTEDLLMS